VRHLAGSLKRAILKCTFSTSLFCICSFILYNSPLCTWKLWFSSATHLALISRAKRFFLFSLLMPENKDVLNVHFRIALFKLPAKCLTAELNQSFQVHNGELYKIKEQIPCIIETIIMCYKGYCGYSGRVFLLYLGKLYCHHQLLYEIFSNNHWLLQHIFCYRLSHCL
jgi:hypothetical protein